MILLGSILLCALALWLATAAWVVWRVGTGWRQALLYAPLKLFYRIDDRGARHAREAAGPVIYVVVHQSRLDPALALSLLPEETLHILDERSARAGWLEPWRDLARTIAFNAKHVFVSRRLVRRLKGGGRLAVYIPDGIEPDGKAFRLYRAVARIAATSEALVAPIFIAGGRDLPMGIAEAGDSPRRWFPRLKVVALEPMTLSGLALRAGRPQTAANGLFDRIAEARLAATMPSGGLMEAFRDSAARFGADRVAVEDSQGQVLTWRKLLTGARLLGSRFASLSAPGETVGVLLPNSAPLVATLLGLFSAGRPAAMLNFTAGSAAVTAAIRSAAIRSVVSSRAFVARADLGMVVAAAEAGGARLVWLEDVRPGATWFDKAAAALLWRTPIATTRPADPAIVLFTSGSEAHPKAVVLSHRNVAANAMQVAARLAFSPRDVLLNPLPAFHSFGLTGGIVLPLLAGVKLFAYPSPLHYRQIPETAARVRPTILIGTDTFLNAYARAADDADFASLRLVVAGAEPVKAETRRAWSERFGASIVEGFGMTEASPVVAVNTATHGREGSVGRILPGMRTRLEPVDGIAEGGRLWVAGPNLMLGYCDPERPGHVQAPPDGWHDSGDIVSFDREGFVTIRDRAKRFAKIGGEMVSLGAVERLAYGLWPDGRHAAATVPDRRKGEKIVLVTTAGGADVASLRRVAKQQGVSVIAVPDHIAIVDDVPIHATGKTDYPSVRRVALQSLGLEEAA
ncbi:MAG: AMP-binding protein [Rhizobiaceae bacterium]